MTSFRVFLRLSIIVLGGLALGLLAWRVSQSRRPPQSIESPIYGTVPSFSFTDQNNKLFESKNLKGRWWVADFFFTQCMGPCPLLTTRMAELQKKYSEMAAKLTKDHAADTLHTQNIPLPPAFDFVEPDSGRNRIWFPGLARYQGRAV